MQTFEQFRGAVERLRAHRIDDHTRCPALSFRVVDGQAPRSRELRPLGGAGPTDRCDAAGVRTLAGAARSVSRGAVSAVELMREAYAAIGAWNAKVNAFEHLLPEEEALHLAVESDRVPIGNPPRGPLWGLPITIKDVIHVAGMPTTASSKTLTNYVPTADAEAVARLKRAGAIVIGKTTTHEYALGVTTPQSRNPWDTGRDPGGSSGGSAIAVATGMGLGSLGTDTRASIRVPSALCGVVGFKPTYGLVSTQGVVTLSWSMDHTAPMARTTEDVALMLNNLVASDPQDPWSIDGPGGGYRRFVNVDVQGLRVGIPAEGISGAEPGVVAAWKEALAGIESIGVELVEVHEPTGDDFQLANAAGLIVSRCEALAYHRSLVGEGDDRYTPDVREQLEEAGKVLAVDYVQAQRFRSEFLQRMAALLDGLDALAMPTCRVVAPRSEEGDRYFLVLSENCIPWSFIGFPAISVPCGLTPERLPVGIEFVAAPLDDGVLLSLGSAVEALAGVPAQPE